MKSNQQQKRKKRGPAKLSRWANGKKNKRRAIVPVQGVANVTVAEQAPTDNAADTIPARVSIGSKRTKTELKQANTRNCMMDNTSFLLVHFSLYIYLNYR